MMVHAMEVFKAEGVEYVDLGLIPLMLSDEIEPQESRPLRFFQRRIYAWGNSLYNFKGLQFAKSRFQGQVVKTYCCHRSLLPSISMLAMFRMTRLI
jgi:phosphatidylglycerol lysyltransferase